MFYLIVFRVEVLFCSISFFALSVTRVGVAASASASAVPFGAAAVQPSFLPSGDVQPPLGIKLDTIPLEGSPSTERLQRGLRARRPPWQT